jgi:hypothetical protein
MSSKTSECISNLIMCSFEMIVSIVFVYYCIIYGRVYRDKIDTFTMTTFVLVIMTVLTRVPEKMLYCSLEISYENDPESQTSIWFNERVYFQFACANSFSTIMSMCFLTCAVLINSTRWLIVVQILSHNGYISYRRSCIIKFVMAIGLLLSLIICIYRESIECYTRTLSPIDLRNYIEVWKRV